MLMFFTETDEPLVIDVKDHNTSFAISNEFIAEASEILSPIFKAIVRNIVTIVPKEAEERSFVFFFIDNTCFRIRYYQDVTTKVIFFESIEVCSLDAGLDVSQMLY